MPVFSDQVVDAGIHDLLVRMSPHPLSLIGDKDIFLLIGYCVTWAEISDFRRTVSQRPIRYASMIVPFRLRGGAESALWTSQTAIDTALTGDPWASSWMVYCAGGIASHQFDISPLNAEIRTLADSYRLVEHECEDDPEGVGETHSIPHSQWKVTLITTLWGALFSRYSHTPAFSIVSLYGNSVSWPMCVHWVTTHACGEDRDFRMAYWLVGRRDHSGSMRMDDSSNVPLWYCSTHPASSPEPL